MADHDFNSAINDVISICRDAEQGFRGAANAVENPALKRTFEEFSTQRAHFAEQLRAAARNAGLNPENPAGVAGVMHAGWMALKGAVTGHSEHQILEETERGEDLSVKTYREALAKDLPETVRALLQTQLSEVQQAHNYIRELRDNTKRAA